MSIIPSPYTNPEAWATFIVGGSAMPGVLTRVGMPRRKYEYAIQNGYGQGKVVIYRATGILEGIEVEHYIEPPDDTTPGDWDLWEAWMQSMIKGWPAQFQGKPPAFPAVHPAAHNT